MAGNQDDIQQLLEHKRFLDEIEHGVRFANREIIHKRIPRLNKDTILAFAVNVARLRARYLEAAMNIGVSEHGDPPEQSVINDITARRSLYQEARNAFEDLRLAIERGYVDVEGVGGA